MDKVAAVAFFGSIAAVVTYVLVMSVTIMQTRSGCLAAGYPSARVDYARHRYCIKRVDQTDVVVPFDQAVSR